MPSSPTSSQPPREIHCSVWHKLASLTMPLSVIMEHPAKSTCASFLHLFASEMRPTSVTWMLLAIMRCDRFGYRRPAVSIILSSASSLFHLVRCSERGGIFDGASSVPLNDAASLSPWRDVELGGAVSCIIIILARLLVEKYSRSFDLSLLQN